MKQRFYNSPVAFCILLGVTMLVYMGCTGSYSTGTITTLQRQFQYKSTEIGVLLTVNHVVGIVMVTLTAYYGKSRHRPWILGCFTLLFAVACVISTLPQFLEDDVYINTTSSANSSSGNYICDLSSVPDDEEKCSDEVKENAGAQHLKAIWLYIGQALFGIAASGYWSLGISYLDDGVPRESSTLYISAVMIVSSLGTFLAFALSAFSLTYHTDFYKIDVSELGYDDQDPRWIGAWWLGYLIYAGIFVIIGIPYFFFPKEWPKKGFDDDENIKLESKSMIMDEKSCAGHRRECQTELSDDVDEIGIVVPSVVKGTFQNGADILKGHQVQMNGIGKQNGHGRDVAEGINDLEKLDVEDKGSSVKADDDGNGKDDEENKGACSLALITGYLSSMIRLCLNMTYLAITMGIVTQTANGTGYYYFIGLYLQTEYHITPADVSTILNAVTTPTTFFGVLLSCVLIKRMNLDARGLMKMSVICTTITMFFVAGNFAIGCGNAPIAGVTTPYAAGEVNLESAPSCMTNCGCEKGVYTPVCGSDGLTYVTPCHAGCIGVQENDEGETIYTNCTCVSPSATAGSQFERSSVSVKNQCPLNCRTRTIISIFLYCSFSFFIAIMGNSSFIAKLRTVENRDKAVAIALGSFFKKVLAFIPAPIYYGLAIQSTCLVFQESCGETGNCLIYDTDLLVIRFWGLYLGLTFAVLICYGVGLISFRRDADGNYIPLKLKVKRRFFRKTSGEE